ncbi:MAG: hypothetical protein KDA84_04825 [Planctomycetaceae bacterium]|nr:hypothetical protein [Planctomycetaceae bacterium]
MTRWGCLLLGLLTAPGCAVVDMGVSNPIPGLSRVAVVPFFNLSTEPSADGHRFAEAYFAELQKVPGFQVLPIGVAEAAIQDHHLNMQNPDDAIKLGKLLGVDAVVVGAVTDYSPYYPQRVGWQVSWYSAHPWTFYPGIPTDPSAREAYLKAEDCPDECESGGWWHWLKHRCKRSVRNVRAEHDVVFRGQSEPTFPPRPNLNEPLEPPRPLIKPQMSPWPGPEGDPSPTQDFSEELPPALPSLPPIPREPLMAYTRLFDAADADFTATFRDYLELRDDLRAGGWRASLHRTDDFIRFTAHRMVVEMLALHGGETRRRVVFFHRRKEFQTNDE